jgi:hypothetical protein
VKWRNGALVISWSGLGDDVDASTFFVKIHFAIHERKQCPIAARANVLPGDKLCSALTHQDASCSDKLSAKSLYAQPFADAITSIPDAALTFLVCHKILSVD